MPGGLIVLHQGLTLQERRLEVTTPRRDLATSVIFFFQAGICLVSVFIVPKSLMVFRIPLVS